MSRKRTKAALALATPALDNPVLGLLPAPAPVLDAVLDAPIPGLDDQDPDGEGGFEPTSRSIVLAKYRREYAKTNRSCDDTLARELRAYLFDDEDGELLNFAKLVRFAKANDCWQDSYSRLNPGQVRMNVGNRLRARVRKNHQPVWVD